jgi:hypothetical protein
MNNASIYSKKDGWYVHADSRTTVGVYIGATPYLKVAFNASSEDLGKAITSALEGSQVGVPHPTEWEHIVRPVYELAKVKTWHRFARDARRLSARLDDNGLTVEPWTKDRKMNFFPISDASLHLPRDASAAEIGDAVKRAVALCT